MVQSFFLLSVVCPHAAFAILTSQQWFIQFDEPIRKIKQKIFPRVKNSRSLHRTFNVEPLYLQHENTGLAIDYMVSVMKQYLSKHKVQLKFVKHWQVPLSKRFRALKLWFVLRNYGISGLQVVKIQHRTFIITVEFPIRTWFVRMWGWLRSSRPWWGQTRGLRSLRPGQRQTLSFSCFLLNFIFRHLGMVVFRLKGDCSMTETLLKKLNSSGKLHAVPCCIKGRYVIRYWSLWLIRTSWQIIIIRFTVTSQRTTAQVRKYFFSVWKFYDFHKRIILLSVFTNVVLN